MCAAAGSILPEQKRCFDSQADAADASACFLAQTGQIVRLEEEAKPSVPENLHGHFSEEGEAVCGIFVSFNVLLNYLNNLVN